MKKRFFSHWRRLLISSLLMLVLTAIGLVTWAGWQIASPSRRPLMDYHQEILTAPNSHGMTSGKVILSDGTPVMVCAPVASGNFGKRGVIIRDQLMARGLQMAAAGQIKGTLVLLHGRKGRKEDYLPIAERLCAAGFRCLIPDLPAHGEHPASVATYGVREAELPERVLRETAQRFSFSPEPAGLLGMSMGGSVAVHAAALPDAPWKALVVISSFDSFPKVIESQAGQYIGPTLGPLWAKGTATVYEWKSGISLSAIQPRNHAATLRLPTFIAHGTADRVATMSCGKCLYDALPTNTLKRWTEIPAADHDNVLITAYPIYADIAEWMLKYVAAP